MAPDVFDNQPVRSGDAHPFDRNPYCARVTDVDAEDFSCIGDRSIKVYSLPPRGRLRKGCLRATGRLAVLSPVLVGCRLRFC